MLGFDKPKLLEEVQSRYSGNVRVMRGYGTTYVTTGGWTQTGGVIEDVWKPVLKKIGKKNKTWLVLGLAGGTVAKTIAKKYKPIKIVGVEIDPDMIRIGNMYLGMDKIPNLKVVCADASTFSSPETFDYVLVDMYLGDKLPDFVYADKFLKKLKTLGTQVVINHLFHEVWMKENAQKLLEKLKKIFPSVHLVRVLTNLMIICA